jgi:hypothetical protein
MPRNEPRHKRFIDQAINDYAGTPKRIARVSDACNEIHVVIEMVCPDIGTYWLDWIGAEFADQPDEFDEFPFLKRDLGWRPIKDGKQV